jgi:hypothetical protein
MKCGREVHKHLLGSTHFTFLAHVVHRKHDKKSPGNEKDKYETFAGNCKKRIPQGSTRSSVGEVHTCKFGSTRNNVLLRSTVK